MATVTHTQTRDTTVKDKQKHTSKIVNSGRDLDGILEDLKKADNICCFSKCKKKTADFAITCRYCKNRFCTSHGLPEIHGCGEAVRRDEKQKFLHPAPKLSQDKHAKAADKLATKIKQMQFERKSKQCSSSNKGKKV